MIYSTGSISRYKHSTDQITRLHRVNPSDWYESETFDAVLLVVVSTCQEHIEPLNT